MFQEEWNTHTKLDHYLAQIAFHVYTLRFILGGTPDKKESDFLIKFTLDKPEELTEEELEERAKEFAAKQKLAILSTFGFAKDGTKKERARPKAKQPMPPVKAGPQFGVGPAPRPSPQKAVKPHPTTRKR